MKKIKFIIPALLFLFLAACSGGGEKTSIDSVQSNYKFVYTVVTIEGCEYFRYQGAHGFLSLEHKGNCSNPVHCRIDTNKTTHEKTHETGY
ncbi:MAG: hypothetical protein FD123_2732 [Bacteroidetes bacterium]|nr:MAG: hypothetical protein FD123_2732 [Bacteroidota bacterium]